MKKMLHIVIIILFTLSNVYAWGWGSHRVINEAAVDHLPPEMSFFQDHREYLRVHSVDPDYSSDPNPGYYHYIDIDYFDEFFAGTLPHDLQELYTLYGQSIVNDQGLVPWVITWWMEDMTELMAEGNWNDIWQIAAELGHYVADSHQALHLTVNYNGWDTGNGGIHSRYETQMMNDHLDDITFADSISRYWETPIDSIFSYIEDIYPLVDLVMAADDRASAQDPSYGNTYLSMMWDDLGDTTTWSLERAVLDLASIWYTAWINAGSPYPPGVAIDDVIAPEQQALWAFPNPFNGETTLQFHIPSDQPLSLNIFNLKGRFVTNLTSGYYHSGDHTYQWDGKDHLGEHVTSGVYFCELNLAGTRTIQKLTVIN